MKLFLLSFVFLDVNVVNFNLPDLLIFCPCCLLRLLPPLLTLTLTRPSAGSAQTQGERSGGA